MGYDISLIRGKSRAEFHPVPFDELPKGGNYRFFPGTGSVPYIGEDDLSFHITWNYSWYFYNSIDRKKGVRAIYGKTGREAKKILEKSLPKLDKYIEKERKAGKVLSKTWGKEQEYTDEKALNYWFTCASNAKKAVEGLIKLADIAPWFTFVGD